MSELRTVVADFTSRLASFIEAEVLARTRQTILGALGGGTAAKRRGRPPKALTAVATTRTAAKTSSRAPKPSMPGKPSKPRKKAPLQLCPVPGCKNAAAPVFGMVCSKHRAVPKRLIKKYREARKAKKVKGEARPAAKPRRRMAKRAQAVAKTKRTQVVARALPPAQAAADAAPPPPSPPAS